MKIYFAHHYSSWERATNEKTIGLIKRYLPLGMNINQIDNKQLLLIQEELTTSTRKLLGVKTPQECVLN